MGQYYIGEKISDTDGSSMESDSLQPLQGTVSSLHLPTCKRKRRGVVVQEWFKRREKELRSISLWRAVVSECLATFFYIFLTLLPTVTMETESRGQAHKWTDVEVIRSALGFGLCMGVLAHCFGSISGVNLNPAVSVSLVVTRKMSPVQGFLYVLAQCGGSIAGTALLFGIAPAHGRATMGVLLLHPGLGTAQGLALEILMAFLFVFTIFSSLDDKSRIAQGPPSVAVGIANTLLHIVGIPLTGCGLNPARALGPAFIKNQWIRHWIYWLGPVLGGVLAGLLYVYIFHPAQKKSVDTVEVDDIPEEAPSPPVSLPRGFYAASFRAPGKRPPHIVTTRPRGHANNAYEYGGHMHHATLPPGPYKLVKVMAADDTDEYGYTKTSF